MGKNDKNREQFYLVFRLGLERCQQNLAHLHALIHAGGFSEESVLSAALVALLVNLEKEILTGREWLDSMAA